MWHKYELEGHIDCGYMAVCPEQTAPLHDQEASLAITHQRSTQDIQKYQIKDPTIRVVLWAEEKDRKLNRDQATGKGQETQWLVAAMEALV